jgi:hypothetical protein
VPKNKRIKDFYKTGTRNQRVFTLTTLQYIVGFVISVTFSMILGPLFEAYGPRYLEGAAHGFSIIKELLFEEQGPPLVLEPQPELEQAVPVAPKIPAEKGSYDAIGV